MTEHEINELLERAGVDVTAKLGEPIWPALLVLLSAMMSRIEALEDSSD